MAAAGTRDSGGGRIAAIDWLKAVAIVAVVLSHAKAFGPSDGPIGWFLGSGLLSFHVPVFYVVSGFLYASVEPVSLALVRRRLGRILWPYLLASVVAIGLVRTRAAWPTVDMILVWLATGGAIGIYYYVFKMALLIPLVWPLSRMRPSLVAALLGGVSLMTVVVALRSGFLFPQSWYWLMRNPLQNFTLGYFLVGWVGAAFLPPLRAFAGSRRVLAWAVVMTFSLVGALALVEALPERPPLGRMVYTLGVVGVGALVPWRGVPPVVAFLSETSLGIYLYHRIFQILAAPVLDGVGPSMRMLASFAIALGGSILLMAAARRLLGPASARRWMGA